MFLAINFYLANLSAKLVFFLHFFGVTQLIAGKRLRSAGNVRCGSRVKTSSEQVKD